MAKRLVTKWSMVLVIAALAAVAALVAFQLARGESPKRPSAPQRTQANQATFQDSIGEAVPVTPERAKGDPVTFQDTSGEAPASADITTVKVASDIGGVTFEIVLAGRFGPGITIVAYLDTDQTARTGVPVFGADYAAVLSDPQGHDASLSLRRWNGTTFSEVSSKQLRIIDEIATGSVLTFSLDGADLDRPRGLNFAVTSESRSQPTRRLDRAPDAGRTPWSFEPARDASADIATVVVSNDDAGVLTFQLVFAAKLLTGSSVVVQLDSDRNARTGAQARDGADYAVTVSNVRKEEGDEDFLIDYRLGRWDGTRFKLVDQSAHVSAGAAMTLKIDSYDLGRPSGFNFAVATKSDGDQATRTLDRAPDPGQAPWSFDIKVRPVQVSVAGFTASPRTEFQVIDFKEHRSRPPRAGRSFVASMIVKASAPIDLFRVLETPDQGCEASIGGQPLGIEYITGGGFNSSDEFPDKIMFECQWDVPSSGIGKLFRGSVKLTFRGKLLMRSFTARITD